MTANEAAQEQPMSATAVISGKTRGVAPQMKLEKKKKRDKDALTIVQLRVQVDDDAQGETLLEFECDWKPGIGGSIWTSGELLAAHLQLHREHYRSIFDGAHVVEVGSGTGYVGLMVAACFKPAHVYLTDLSTHLRGLHRNVERNAPVVRTGVQVHVSELRWGSLEQEIALLESIAGTSCGKSVNIDAAPQVNVILGTDVAYLQELYDPLLHTMNHLATSRTLILLGLNRTDTRHTFFQQLEQIGFEYYRIPDCKLPPTYWSCDFGLFEIRRNVLCEDI